MEKVLNRALWYDGLVWDGVLMAEGEPVWDVKLFLQSF